MISTVTYKGIPFDLMSSEVEGERKLKTDGTAKDFLLEIRKGNVPGHRLVGVIGVEENSSSTTFKDIWAGTDNMVFRNDGVAETWEIVSSSDEDKVGGLGATEVRVIYLDNNYLETSVLVTLNGTTPVQIATNCYRPSVTIVTKTEPSVEMQNVGKITVRVAGGGAERDVMRPATSASSNGHFTVPANTTAIFLQVMTFLPKNVDADIATYQKAPLPTSPWSSTLSIPYYQNSSKFEVMARISTQEKTDIAYRAKTSESGQSLTVIREFILIDNNYL